MKTRLTLWIIILLTILSIFIDLPSLNLFKINTPELNLGFLQRIIPSYTISPSIISENFPIKLGLDLQGGTQLVLQTDMSKIPQEDKDTALESAREVIERRVNLFGVSESLVQSSRLGNQRRILVDLPGVKDASEAASLVGKTAQLEIREISDEDIEAATGSAFSPKDLTKSTGITGADLEKFEVTFGSGGTDAGPQVSLTFTADGGKKFAGVTKRNVGKELPIFLDDEIILSPVVQQEIIGANAVITGSFTPEEAKRITSQLNAGALPVPIEIIEQRSVGASLGEESVEKSLVAGIIGLLTVMIFMALYYGKLGLIADLALIIYTLLVLAIFKTGLFVIPPVTLTLAGIAGFVLSIGMAVDANILIFERMKEEIRWGANKKQALENGFKRAWTSIRDSNISSLITAGILYFLGTGLVKGFAVTLSIGVLVSMFTAIIVTRTFLRIFIK